MLSRNVQSITRLCDSSTLLCARRYLNLQEYQSKQILQENGLNIQRFFVAKSIAEAETGINSFHADEYVVKAQILAGGRGKGTFSSGFQGGVKLTKSKSDVTEYVRKMLGYHLVTKQTPPEGVQVQTVMVAQALDIARETYLAILMDREKNSPVIVASPEGGMDIEAVADESPDKIYKEYVNITEGLSLDRAQYLAKKLLFEGSAIDQAADQIIKLFNLFLKVDATQIEINPLGLTPDNQVVCFDAKLNFDDSAEFRQKNIFAMEDHSETDAKELEAHKNSLNYVSLDGNIGCLVNGAGLAMATMDIIDLHGGRPANFLDVGGMVNESQVTKAFEILTSDGKVKAILVNVFGGIVNCATIANGLTGAFRSLKLNVPLVVRLEGTNVEAARQILSESGLPIINATDLDDAGKKAVQCLN